MSDSSDRSGKQKKSVADRLVELTFERYRVGRTADGQPFAVLRDGPNVALPISDRSFKSDLAGEYFRRFEGVAGATAMADAVAVIEGRALAEQAEPVELRVGKTPDGAIVLDLGHGGSAVVIDVDGWRVVERSPILFRRTALTGELPIPERGGSLSSLRQLVNVAPEHWELALGWLVASLIPDIGHAILLIDGLQGSGKSSFARLWRTVIDSSPCPLASEPRDPESWVMGAFGSWIVAVDNISKIPPWWSESLCRAVTGDGWVRRKLYSDSSLSVLSFRRCVMLTSIDAGALRGDLADRLLKLRLVPLDRHSRRYENEIESQFRAAWPRILGAVLDLTVRVLRQLKTGPEPPELPRLADFGRVLWALDRAFGFTVGKGSFDAFMGQRGTLARDVVEADSVASMVLALAMTGRWQGTMAGLNEEIRPDHPPRDWPANPRALAARLARVEPALKELGVTVEHWRGPAPTRERLVAISMRQEDRRDEVDSLSS